MTGSRQYHIALERGELAEYIVLVGDPGGVAKVASRWESVELERSNREITTATGTYQGMRLSAMSTGMGTDNVEIVLAEVMEITDRPTLIRIGSSGALLPEIALGDLIVSMGPCAWRTRPTSTCTPDTPPSPTVTWSGPSRRHASRRVVRTTLG